MARNCAKDTVGRDTPHEHNDFGFLPFILPTRLCPSASIHQPFMKVKSQTPGASLNNGGLRPSHFPTVVVQNL